MNSTPRSYRWLFLLAAPTALAILLLMARIVYTKDFTFLFLVWNLFLAFIPLGLALIIKRINARVHRMLFYPLLGIWLLFLPNAPYILTDLLHLHYDHDMPVWFDMTMILTFAWSGLVAGFYSLLWVQDCIEVRFRGRVWVGRLFAVLTVFASAYGIYLGRFLRWNSWDIIEAPGMLVEEIIHSLTHSSELLHTYGFTLSFGFLLLFMYLMANGLKMNSDRKAVRESA
ncbi:MAG: DUF1361 domain-containing protein [Flavobacteriales bacterium]|nr:DUF1361 domain-containing protein [Flavobacteriales bacterium]MDG1780872.1 DUF1361 domain-containing protein [Flavobacteriales bacterium]MDG2246703.1 DUF1361 domain-containing protein [Flavobacteriales bacterium]